MPQRAPQQIKRKHSKRLWRIWPFFVWQYCAKCRQMFRREWGWRAGRGKRTAHEYGATFAGGTREICHRCAPTRDDAIAAFGLPATRAEECGA